MWSQVKIVNSLVMPRQDWQLRPSIRIITITTQIYPHVCIIFEGISRRGKIVGWHNLGIIFKLMFPSQPPSQVLNDQSHSRLRYARLLLQAFRNDSPPNATIDDYLVDYSEGVTPPGGYRSKLNEQLLIGHYNNLKKSLHSLQKEHAHNLARLQELNKTRYTPIKQIIAQKQEASLQNLQIRLNSIQPSTDNDDDEFLRVQKLIQNGLWGCLGRLNDRIVKLTALQQDE